MVFSAEAGIQWIKKLYSVYLGFEGAFYENNEQFKNIEPEGFLVYREQR